MTAKGVVPATVMIFSSNTGQPKVMLLSRAVTRKVIVRATLERVSHSSEPSMTRRLSAVGGTDRNRGPVVRLPEGGPASTAPRSYCSQL